MDPAPTTAKPEPAVPAISTKIQQQEPPRHAGVLQAAREAFDEERRRFIEV
jgi:hypothetical protein